MLLVGGQALGQLAMLFALPVITRSYVPHDVGLFQIANAIALILQPLASWRHEFIIPTASTEQGALRFFRRGLTFTAGATGSALVGAAIFYAASADDAAAVCLMIAPLVAAYSALALDNAVLIRRQLSRRLAVRNALSGLLGGTLQVLVAVAGLALPFLAVAVLLARGIAVASTRKPWHVSTAHEHESVLYGLRRSLPTVMSGLVSNASVNALPLVVPIAGSAAAAGYAGIAQRIAAAPNTFLGQALGQAVQSSVAPKVRNGVPTVNRTVQKYLLVASLPVVTIAAATASAGLLLAEPILGQGWQPAGVMLAVLALPFALQIMIAPINPILVMIGREGSLLVMQLARLAFSAGISVGVGVVTHDAVAIVIAFSASTTVAYAATGAVILRLCAIYDKAQSQRHASQAKYSTTEPEKVK